MFPFLIEKLLRRDDLTSAEAAARRCGSFACPPVQVVTHRE
jgi:hypothetical protein